jgi:hypothetical protein
MAAERAEVSRSVVRGSRLHIDLLEQAGLLELAVGGGVECHPARKRQTRHVGSSSNLATEVEDCAIEARLECCCDVFVHPLDRSVRRSRREQLFGEISPRTGVELALVSRAIPQQRRDLPTAILAQLHRFIEEGGESFSVTVGSKSHDLVFVGVEVEAKMQGDDRIEDSDRGRGRDS